MKPNPEPSAGEPQLRSVGERRELRDTDDIVIPIVKEELHVGKREVDAGGVRVTSRVTEEPIQKTITLREERVTVERRIVDRPIGPEDEAYRERAVDLEAMAEEPVVTKRAHVVEEIRIHRDRTERVEKISDSLRHTDVDIKELAGGRLFDASPYADHFNATYAGKGELRTFAPAYEFGERLGRSTKGDFATVEPNARTAWTQMSPSSKFDNFREAIRAGFLRARNKL
jgi:uncharacterized protein (TIGR02271 family)